MEEDLTQSGGAAGAEGGASAEEAGSSGQTSDKDKAKDSPKTVSWENHQRALGDLHKNKKLVQELETRIGDLESKSLKEKQDYKTLYEREKDARAKAAKEAEKIREWATHTQRFSAVKEAALKAGLVPKSLDDLELLDLSSVQVEVTNTGRFAVEGHDSFVESLKQNRPHWFQSTKAPTVNSGGGGAPPAKTGELSPNDVYQAERQWKAGKLSRKDYEDTHRRYVAQTAQKAK